MLKQKRAIVLITCAIIVFALFFSLFFIIAESNHDCTGEHCAVCFGINICEQTLKSLSTVIIASAFICSLVLSSVALGYCIFNSKRSFSLVLLKVKLSN